MSTANLSASMAGAVASPAPRYVVKGIDEGCRRILIAKLRERGLDQGRAAALAESLLPMAVSFWQKRLERLQSGTAPEQDPERPYSEAFAELAKWVDEIGTGGRNGSRLFQRPVV